MTGLADAIAELRARIATGLSPAELIDIITACENDKRSLAALQAEATASYATEMRARDENRDRTSAAISREIALARKCSPHSGGTWLGVADTLTTEMPRTFRALRDGRICELTARDVVSQTTHVSAEHRAVVDAALVKEFNRAGTTRHAIKGSARALADQLDPRAAVERRKKAEGNRRVTLSPGEDSMTILRAVLPIDRGVACEATLRRDARALLDNPDEDRTESQIKADLLYERVTGAQIATDALPVEVHLVMTEETLLRGGDASASFVGIGPIAATHARELVANAAETDQAWIRRIYTTPDQSTLLAMDSTKRLFTKGLARFIRLRDQRCATPSCDAPVQHIDHLTPWSRGGTTTLDNGQGLCARCNYTKDLPGFRTLYDPDTRVTTFITRTGHRYDRQPPPVLGHLTLPERRKHDRRRTDRRDVDLAA
jgi:hypothetical protein